MRRPSACSRAWPATTPSVNPPAQRLRASRPFVSRRPSRQQERAKRARAQAKPSSVGGFGVHPQGGLRWGRAGGRLEDLGGAAEHDLDVAAHTLDLVALVAAQDD